MGPDINEYPAAHSYTRNDWYCVLLPAIVFSHGGVWRSPQSTAVWKMETTNHLVTSVKSDYTDVIA